ncbi:MAG: DUF4013 domain-containing protein [Oscillochloris sp.]|nr:DUF4013 domain-containing protein [Oscillochloris sp.]
MRPSGGAPALSLRAALTTISRDRSWPLKVLLYGACALTLIGLPITVGFVLDSLDNSRKGFAYPLPPWTDWSIRWLGGLLALLIDVVFFLLPLLASGMLSICVSIGIIAAGLSDPAVTGQVFAILAICCGAILTTMFFCGAAPAGRLLFVREGHIDQALSMNTLRWTTSPPARMTFLRARLRSLPAYLPSVLVFFAIYNLAPLHFPGQMMVMIVGLWLLSSSLVLAHLVVVQLYVAAEYAIMRSV